MTGWSVGLGLRLAFGTDRSGWVRLLLMIGGVALGVAMLLGVAGVHPAVAARIDKTAGRGVEIVPDGEARTEGVRASLSVGFWRGREVRILQVEVVGPPVAPPLGVPRTPEPGEVFVSPALASALAGRHGAELAPRLPGPVVGAVTRAGLVGPDELYAVVGAAPGALENAGWAGMSGLSPGFARPEPGSLFASQASYRDGTGMRQEANAADELAVAVGLAGVGLVMPLLILVGTSTRLSAASRERRASAMRLVGATARQLRMFGAAEAAAVGVLGTLAGAGLFLLLRAPLVALLPFNDGVYAGDVAPPLIAALLVLIGVPGLTVLAGSLALRRASSSPLGVRRQGLPARPGFVRLLPLGVGLAMVGGAYADRQAVLAGTRQGQVLLLGGAALCLVGIAIGAAALSRLAGLTLSRWGTGLGSQLAGRRLVGDPAGAARAITGTAVTVVVLGWIVALLPSLYESTSHDNEGLVEALRPDTVVVSLGASTGVDSTVARLRSVPGVSQAVPVRHFRMLPPGVRPADCCSGSQPRIEEYQVRGIVADCEDLGRVLRAPLPGCRAGAVQRLAGSYFDAATLTAAGRLQPLDEALDPLPGPVLDVPAELTTVSMPAGLTGRTDGLLLEGDLLIPQAMLPGPLPDTWFPNVLVATDGRPATIEAVRASLGPQPTPFPPLTAEETVQLARSASEGYTRAALVTVLAVVLAGGLSLAVTAVDSLRERQRAHSALTAMGTPVRVLRRSVMLQTALPLLLNVGLAIIVAAATSWLYVELTTPAALGAPRLPWAGYSAIGAAALIACLLATAATLPYVRAATRPDALRTE